jgi:hypothetical protein
MQSATDLLVWGLVAHLVADWLLQNEWQAVHKVSLRHPAAWVHAGIHGLALWPVFGAAAAVALGAAHMLIDTRKPRHWWAWLIGQTRDPAQPISMHVAIWSDQVLHVACLAVAAWLGSARC